MSRVRLLREAALYELNEAVNSELLVAAVNDDADPHAANDTEGEDTFSTQMEDLYSLAFWIKKVAGLAWRPTWFFTSTSFMHIV